MDSSFDECDECDDVDEYVIKPPPKILRPSPPSVKNISPISPLKSTFKPRSPLKSQQEQTYNYLQKTVVSSLR